MRSQRDAHLVRYLADIERKEAMMAKMNANDNESKTDVYDSKTDDNTNTERKERKERSSRK